MIFIAKTPASSQGIDYVVSISEEAPGKVEWLRLEILVAGKTYRKLLIDAYALEGVIQCLQRALTLRKQADADTSALLARLGAGS